MSLAPIILFVYNRPWHTQQTVEALQKNELAAESDLFIFADGPKPDASEECLANISKVRNYIHDIDGFKSITIEESPENKGLANSVIAGVTRIINQFGKVIVVEDDIVTHPFFLRFMNEALDFYIDDERIYSIGAFMDDIIIPNNYHNDVFVCRRIETWGWATWQDRWNLAEWDIDKYYILKHPTRKEIKRLCRGGDDLWPLLQMQASGKIDSWAARWQYNLTINNGLCLRPIWTFVNNIGMDGSGTHCNNITNNLSSLPQKVSVWEFRGIQSTPIYNHPVYDLQMSDGVIEHPSLITNLQRYFKQKKIHHSIWIYIKCCIKSWKKFFFHHDTKFLE